MTRVATRRGAVGLALVLFLLPVFAAGAEKDLALAKARAAYEKEGKAVEKKLGRKKKSKKGKRRYQDAMADVIARYVVVLADAAARYRADKQLYVKLNAEHQELEGKLLEFYKDGALVQLSPGGMTFEPVKRGLVQHCERVSNKEIDVAALAQWVCCQRVSCVGWISRYKGGNILSEHLGAKDEHISACFAAGQAVANIYYLKADAAKKKVKMSFSVSKGDKVEAVYVNGRKVKGTTSFKADLRKGVNSVVILANNAKDMTYEYALKVSAKGIQAGKPGR